MSSTIITLEKNKVNKTAVVFGIIFWIIAILILASLAAYQSGSDTGCSGLLGSYENGYVQVVFDILLFIFILIGAYLLFTVWQKSRDFKKFNEIIQEKQMFDLTNKNKKSINPCHSKKAEEKI